MRQHGLLYIKQGLKAHLGVSSPIIIIEGQYLQTFLHTLSLIYALYIDFFSYFATEIIKGIETYGDFCRRYDVKTPIIFKTEDKDKLTGNHMQPLPVNELKASFDMLKNNPNISINIK